MDPEGSLRILNSKQKKRADVRVSFMETSTPLLKSFALTPSKEEWGRAKSVLLPAQPTWRGREMAWRLHPQLLGPRLYPQSQRFR